MRSSPCGFAYNCNSFNHGEIMNIRKSLILTALTISAGTSHAWTLAYANDANGNVTAGSLQTLRTALDQGASLKVLIDSPGVHIWHMRCTHISQRTDAGQVVSCYSHMAMRINGTPGAAFGTILDASNSSTLFANTLGQYAQVRIHVGTNAVVDKSVNNYSMRWYVE